MPLLDSFSGEFNEIITTDAIKFTFLFSLKLPQLPQEEIAYITQNVHELAWEFQFCEKKGKKERNPLKSRARGFPDEKWQDSQPLKLNVATLRSGL